VAAHPSRKNKDAARVGHPIFFARGGVFRTIESWGRVAEGGSREETPVIERYTRPGMGRISLRKKARTQKKRSKVLFPSFCDALGITSTQKSTPALK